MEAAQPEVCVEIKQGRSVVDPLLCPPCQLSLSLLFPHFYTHSRPLKTAAYCPWRNNTGPVLYNAPVQEGKRSLTVPPTCVRALLSGPADRDGRTKSTYSDPGGQPSARSRHNNPQLDTLHRFTTLRCLFRLSDVISSAFTTGTNRGLTESKLFEGTTFPSVFETLFLNPQSLFPFFLLPPPSSEILSR